MSMEFCAYSFLKEDGQMCDYEIATDELASSLSIVKHHVKHIQQADIIRLIELVYHANGSIRGNCAIHQSEIDELKAMYDHYFIKMTHFVVPDGCIGASYLHQVRAKTKGILRLMYAIEKEGIQVASTLLDFMNLLSNTLFMMCLYENKQEHYEEKEFISKSYAC